MTMLKTRGIASDELGLNPQADWGPYVSDHVKSLARKSRKQATLSHSEVEATAGPVPSGQTRGSSSGSSEWVTDTQADVQSSVKPSQKEAVEQATDFRFARRALRENVQKFIDESRGNNRLGIQVLRDTTHIDKHGKSAEDCGARSGRLDLLKM